MSEATQHDAFLVRIQSAMARHDMARTGDAVVVAVSGGVDSMVMLYALQRMHYQVTAAHFDHHTRDGDSAADAAFVQEVGEHLGIPVILGGEDVEEMARRAERSFECYARERRYAFLLNCARDIQCPRIATAHHEDDQIETLLMGVLGLASDVGLGGIAPVRHSAHCRIIRPMLTCARSQIERWARENHIPWREDRTNAETRYMRNHIRHTLTPLLQAYSPQGYRHLARIADIIREDTACLDRLATEQGARCIVPLASHPNVLIIDRKSFNAMPEALRRHTIKLLAARVSVRITWERILDAIAFIKSAKPGRHFDLGSNFCLYAQENSVHVVPPSLRNRAAPPLPTPLTVPGNTLFSHHRFRTRVFAKGAATMADISAWCDDWRQYFDWDTLNTPLLLRSRLPGDRLRLLGMDGRRKVQDIMTECAVPAYLRDTIPIVETQTDILWVAGCRRSAFAPITDQTQQILEIWCSHETRQDTAI